MEDSAAKLRLPVLKHDINQPIAEEPYTPQTSSKRKHSSDNEINTQIENVNMEDLVEGKSKQGMSKFSVTPKNNNTGERIAEESQPLTCQNTVSRK